VLTREIFDEMFPHRIDPACSGKDFTFEALVAAAEAWPAFAGEGALTVRKRELAAFLANVAHETTGGWSTAPDGAPAWGLCFLEEAACAAHGCPQYCDPKALASPCAPDKSYHGRGPIQLSWNSNYARVGDALGLDLLRDPDRVRTDAVIGWKTAIWFWMTASPPRPSPHQVMSGAFEPSAEDVSAGRVPGFGLTIDLVNGNLECGRRMDERVSDRIAFFVRFSKLLGVDAGDNVSCSGMQPYR
jgi:chitinase